MASRRPSKLSSPSLGKSDGGRVAPSPLPSRHAGVYDTLVQTAAAMALEPLHTDQTRGDLSEQLPRVCVAPGTRIRTLDGLLPAEHLLPGDPIVTRNGARRLMDIARMPLRASTPVVRIRPEALGGRSDRSIWLLPSQLVLIRNWRALIVRKADHAAVPVARLVDGEFVRHGMAGPGAAMLELRFEAPQVIYADGLELVVRPSTPVQGPRQT